MTISFKELQQAVGEWDFAMIASSYGHNGTRDILAKAILNLPTEELEKLRPFLGGLIKDAVARTSAKIIEIGIVMDISFPPEIRPSLNVESYFYRKDKK